MLVWAAIGVLSGFLIGFTGAGAALTSTPLFLYLLDMDIKTATVNVLYVIFAGSLTQLLVQRKNVHWKQGFLLILSSFLGSWLTSFLKPFTPNFFIQLFIILLGLYSVYKTWRPSQKKNKQMHGSYFWSVFVLCGLFIGFVITMTGLAGGVVLVPFFISFVGLPPREAVATGLFVMWFNALGSFFFQWKEAMAVFDPKNIAVLLLGCVIAAKFISILLVKVKPERIDSIRKLLFTVLVSVSLVLIGLK